MGEYMRIQVVRIEELWDEQPTYRLCEDSGALCDCWLPGLENPEGPLDCGGFDRRDDAQAFKLGIDRERALFGLIPESVEAIDREREALDRTWTARGRPPADIEPSPESTVEQMVPFYAHIEYRRRVA